MESLGENMSEKLNKRIIEKLEKSDCTKTIKQFLLEVLYFELEIFEEGYPRYTQRYDSTIDKFAKIHAKDETP